MKDLGGKRTGGGEDGRGDDPPPAKPALPIADRDLVRLYDYWTRRRGDRAMPSRAEIDPIEIGFVLGHLMLFDVVQPGPRFRVRLQGSELTWWVGAELTGDLLDGVPHPELRALAQSRLADAVAMRQPLHWIGDHVLDGVRRHYEVLILPMSSTGDAVDMLLAAIRCRSSGAQS